MPDLHPSERVALNQMARGERPTDRFLLGRLLEYLDQLERDVESLTHSKNDLVRDEHARNVSHLAGQVEPSGPA